MAKEKNLRGIPGNLALSYLSTLGYYEDGYMGDWIVRTFKQLQIDTLTIDILNEEVYPQNAKIKPLLSDLPKLKQILKRELQQHHFEYDFIVKAHLCFEQVGKILKCTPFLEDKNGKKYYPKKPIIE